MGDLCDRISSCIFQLGEALDSQLFDTLEFNIRVIGVTLRAWEWGGVRGRGDPVGVE